MSLRESGKHASERRFDRPVTRAHMSQIRLASAELREEIMLTRGRLDGKNYVPAWLYSAMDEIHINAVKVDSFLQGLGDLIPFKPERDTGIVKPLVAAALAWFGGAMVGYVLASAPTVVDLSTPCTAYNAMAAEHELEAQACDPWGQFDFPQNAMQIERLLEQMEGLTNE